MCQKGHVTTPAPASVACWVSNGVGSRKSSQCWSPLTSTTSSKERCFGHCPAMISAALAAVRSCDTPCGDVRNSRRDQELGISYRSAVVLPARSTGDELAAAAAPAASGTRPPTVRGRRCPHGGPPALWCKTAGGRTHLCKGPATGVFRQATSRVSALANTAVSFADTSSALSSSRPKADRPLSCPESWLSSPSGLLLQGASAGANAFNAVST